MCFARASLLAFGFCFAISGAVTSACMSEPAVHLTTMIPRFDPSPIAQAARDPDSRPYPAVTFAATHNSYAGALGDGDVASIRRQLDLGVRMLELDVHDDGCRRNGFRVGHIRPGDDVFHGGGNPESDRLSDWLALIADWSSANPKHAPITLLIDLKDSLADNVSFADGDLTALNAELERAFGPKLFPASELDSKAWPTVGQLRGRILTVLSGSETSRIAYRGERGSSPAVAMNDRGVVIEAHDSGDGELWYWAGEYLADGRVAWKRRAYYDTGKNPAIDVNNDGVVVEVHQDPDHNDDQLWYRVGRLDENLEIKWLNKDGLEFPGSDDGAAPSVRFLAPDSNQLREIHRSPTTNLRWYWDGQLDLASRSVKWTRSGSGRTKEARFARSSAEAGGRSIEVFTGADGAFGSDTLQYSTDRAGPFRIRPSQLAFVELQHDSATQLENDGLLFYSGPAESIAARVWAVTARSAGKIARLWSFNDASLTVEASVNFPATDQPFSSWYDGYRRSLAAVW